MRGVGLKKKMSKMIPKLLSGMTVGGEVTGPGGESFLVGKLMVS